MLYFYPALEIGVNLGQVIPDKILAKYLLTFSVDSEHMRESEREREKQKKRILDNILYLGLALHLGNLIGLVDNRTES